MLAGVRTQASLTDDETWYAAQEAAAFPVRVGGWGAIAGGAVAMIAGIVVGLAEASDTAMIMLVIGPILVGAVWMLAWVMAGGTRGDRVARTMLRERAKADSDRRKERLRVSESAPHHEEHDTGA